MLRRGCRLQANKASVRKTNHYALGCMRTLRRVVPYVIGDHVACAPAPLLRCVTTTGCGNRRPSRRYLCAAAVGLQKDQRQRERDRAVSLQAGDRSPEWV